MSKLGETLFNGKNVFSQPTVEAGTEQGRNVSEWLSQVYLLSIWPENMLKICPKNILKILVLDLARAYVEYLSPKYFENFSFGLDWLQ